MLAPELQERLDSYLIAWRESEAAARVDAVESFGHAHGIGEFQGQTIPDFITYLLNDLLIFLAARPELLDTVVTDEVASRRVAKFLRAEQVKIDEAADLVKEMRKYWLGPIDPRYRRASKRYGAVVKSFKIVDKDYNLNLPPLHELKD